MIAPVVNGQIRAPQPPGHLLSESMLAKAQLWRPPQSRARTGSFAHHSGPSGRAGRPIPASPEPVGRRRERAGPPALRVTAGAGAARARTCCSVSVPAAPTHPPSREWGGTCPGPLLLGSPSAQARHRDTSRRQDPGAPGRARGSAPVSALDCRPPPRRPRPRREGARGRGRRRALRAWALIARTRGLPPRRPVARTPRSSARARCGGRARGLGRREAGGGFCSSESENSPEAVDKRRRVRGETARRTGRQRGVKERE